MPGQGEDLNREQQGQHKEGQKGMGGAPDWKKDKDKEHKGQKGQQGQEGQQGGQQQPHRHGDPMAGQQPKQTDPNKQRQGGTDSEESDERKRRPA